MKKTHENHDRNYHNFVIQRPAAGEKSQVIQPQACHLSLDEVSLPSAVIHASALNNNLKWMQQFANHHQVKLAPHGKTSMTPDFFRQQLEHGAWGITVATAAQADCRHGRCEKHHHRQSTGGQSQHGHYWSTH